MYSTYIYTHTYIIPLFTYVHIYNAFIYCLQQPWGVLLISSLHRDETRRLGGRTPLRGTWQGDGARVQVEIYSGPKSILMFPPPSCGLSLAPVAVVPSFLHLNVFFAVEQNNKLLIKK